MHTADVISENLAKLAELFPNVITETKDSNGNIVHAVDKDKLMQEINCQVVDGTDERYQFTWPDKRKAVLTANSPINATLRPCREESLDFDNTKNLYIEGDNLDVLKCLKETYSGKVKMIYIDPPYNTGNDFVYQDDFVESTEEYLGNSGQYDEQGNRLVANTESNGRFHTDWLNMMYPRLKVSHDLLKNDGVVFISIDDNEVENLRKLCDEIFGESNFLAQVVWERAFSPVNLMKHFSPSHDYILCYAKNAELLVSYGIPRNAEANDRYSNPDNDPRGLWTSGDLSVGPAIQSNIYPITTPSGKIVYPPSGYSWRVSELEFKRRVADNRIWFGDKGDNVPRIKRFLSELKKQGITPMTYWHHEDVGHSQSATQYLMKLFDGKKVFDYPKPVELIKRCIALYTTDDDIILDYFSGSATTAESVFSLNVDDDKNRRFILVQLPELVETNSVAGALGYNNICDIARERIRRAGNKIKEELGVIACNIDTGFRVLKLDSSNMLDVYYTPSELSQTNLFTQTDNIKSDRNNEDLLFQVMLELGATLDSKIERQQVAGKEIFNVADNYLIACFAENVTDEVVTAIAKQQPQYAVFRDSSMADDSTATNFEQIFKTYSPNTQTRVL